jgi:glycine cleavage system T protein
VTGAASLLRTPLHDAHLRLGARMVPFAGYEMPVQYTSIIAEHRTVRDAVGLFDLSHMGELFVEGPEAGAALAAALVSDPPSLAVGRAPYSMICAPDGGVLDDLIVYRVGEESFLVVANAANAQVVSDTLTERLAGRRAVLDDRSLATALIAIQGPAAVGILGPLADLDLGGLRYYGIAEGRVAGARALVARTGYTGEDGFELYLPSDGAPRVWREFLETGATPVGLGARDTLRLEAGMCLYGNELDPETTPLEAGIGVAGPQAKEQELIGPDAVRK